MKFQHILLKELEVGSYMLSRSQIKIKIHRKPEQSSNAQYILIPFTLKKKKSLY